MKCSCCNEREADTEYPLQKPTRSIAGKPISSVCFAEFGLVEMSNRIYARENAKNPGSFKGVTNPLVIRSRVDLAASQGLPALAALHSAGVALQISTDSELLEWLEPVEEPSVGDIAVGENGLTIVGCVFRSGRGGVDDVADEIANAESYEIGTDATGHVIGERAYYSIRKALAERA